MQKKSIANLSEIILQMVELYAKYIDYDMFIASVGFEVWHSEDVMHYDLKRA
ncbi:MAG: hypothetical protein IJE05_00555 [Clostridia bacterium]|nr:hypothetical protein [Clostridia bacterium]